MKTVLKNSMLIIAGVSLLALSSCQKSNSRGIKGKVGGGGGTTAVDQFDQQVDKAILENKSAETCSEAVLALKKTFDAELEKSAAILKIVEGDENALIAQSANLAKAAKALHAEILKNSIAVCGTDQKVSLDATRKAMHASVLAIAAKLGKDTVESTAVKKKQGTDSKKTEDKLSGTKFKMSQALADALNQDQKKVLFIVDGVKNTTKKNYDEAIKDAKKTVCHLSLAPDKTVDVGVGVHIVSANLTTIKKIADSADSEVSETDSDEKMSGLEVRMEVRDKANEGSQVVVFMCRLGEKISTGDAVKTQFLATFGTLLTK